MHVKILFVCSFWFDLGFCKYCITVIL
uniref:Uncharacterized protein n=1 Tax=Anguilla anguilla TaxID=7936 RepID=A0A0E9X947_ANGAN